MIKIFYLEMTDRAAFRPKPCPDPAFEVKECKIKNYRYNQFLYFYVGEKFQWFDKSEWSDKQWKAYAESDDLRTFVAYHGGTPAGYFELQRQPEGNVEIKYFGLEGKFIGKGLGGFLLSHAIEEAWQWDAGRVWVHTCTLDHPNALRNYEARGMSHYKTEVQKEGD